MEGLLWTLLYIAGGLVAAFLLFGAVLEFDFQRNRRAPLPERQERPEIVVGWGPRIEPEHWLKPAPRATALPVRVKRVKSVKSVKSVASAGYMQKWNGVYRSAARREHYQWQVDFDRMSRGAEL